MFMGEKDTVFGRCRQPNSVGLLNYRIRMNRKDSKKVLWANVSRLMVARYGKENLTRLSQEAGIGPATCSRIKQQTTSVGTDVIEAIAKALKVSTWQLLVVDLDPNALPVLTRDQPNLLGVSEPQSTYSVTSPADSIRAMATALTMMSPDARESAASLLASMARKPDGPWVDWLTHLVTKELGVTEDGAATSDRAGKRAEDGAPNKRLQAENELDGPALTPALKTFFSSVKGEHDGVTDKPAKTKKRHGNSS
jgi:hypothetical protein